MDSIGAAGVAVIGFGALYIIWLAIAVADIKAGK
jgi:hypothetical protein